MKLHHLLEEVNVNCSIGNMLLLNGQQPWRTLLRNLGRVDSSSLDDLIIQTLHIMDGIRSNTLASTHLVKQLRNGKRHLHLFPIGSFHFILSNELQSDAVLSQTGNHISGHGNPELSAHIIGDIINMSFDSRVTGNHFISLTGGFRVVVSYNDLRNQFDLISRTRHSLLNHSCTRRNFLVGLLLITGIVILSEVVLFQVIHNS